MGNAATKKELSKEERIKKEKTRLTKLMKKISDDQKKSAEKLIHNASFMAITLDDLQDSINVNGVISEYQNGENQWGTKKSPEVEVYNTMIKNYSAIMKQLFDMIPKELILPKEDKDDFEEFVGKRK